MRPQAHVPIRAGSRSHLPHRRAGGAAGAACRRSLVRVMWPRAAAVAAARVVRVVVAKVVAARVAAVRVVG